MSILSLVSGTLHRDPETRAGKKGDFTIATVKHLDGGGRAQFVRVTAFDPDAAAELAGLSKGDAVTVTGRLEAEIYQKDGEPPRVSLSIVAERVVALKQINREKIAASRKGEQNGLLGRY